MRLRIFDPVIADLTAAREDAEHARALKRAIKDLGGSRLCKGRCGRTVSMSRGVCAPCARRLADIESVSAALAGVRPAPTLFENMWLESSAALT